MRVLVNSMAPSHFLPMVPFTWALRAAGHEVLFLGYEETARTAHEAGILTRQLSGDAGSVGRWRPPVKKKDPFWAPGSTQAPPPPQDARTTAIAGRWKARIEIFIDEYLEFAQAWSPDVIMTDPMEFSGMVAAAALDVPCVVHRWGFDAFTSTLLEPARHALRETCARLGAENGMADAALVLDPCPPNMMSSNLVPGMPVRWVPYNGTAAVPQWAVKRGAGTRICMSFGLWSGEALAQGGDLHAVIEGVNRATRKMDDVEVLLLAPKEYHADLGTVPDTIRVVDQLPVSAVMRDTDVLVHHGGGGGSLTAYAYGVPQVVVAQEGPMLVQVGETVAQSGAGLGLVHEADRVDVGLISDAVTDVLTEPGYRKAAERVRAEMAATPSPAEIVPVLESLVDSRTT
ncbi:nucleotide disphospho-sugar-binding domain-containing protein [Microtetraspora malaysiensis]|uniref:nucleotide disphospho-sugar-binding domain-containing protein n=1 Tax=Microtetraspora malaysiensis TaxID=161358 RepID=UPI003D915C91